MTTTDTFASPDPVEIIPADQIRPLIAATERELEVLERTAAEAIAAADDAEEWERSATNDGDTSAWSLIRAHREERDEAQRDAQVMIDLASRHAEYVIDEARAEADEILGRGARIAARPSNREPAPPANGGFGAAPAVEARVVETRVVDAPIAVPPAAAPIVTEPPSAPSASASNGKGAQATAVLDVPTVQIPVVIPAPAPATVAAPAPERVVPPAPIPPAPTAVSEPVVVPPQPAVVAAQPSVANDGFWTAEGSPKRRFALPFSAVLEASAVLLILVFILLRLS